MRSSRNLQRRAPDIQFCQYWNEMPSANLIFQTVSFSLDIATVRPYEE
jgi:hypothetical protein